MIKFLSLKKFHLKRFLKAKNVKKDIVKLIFGCIDLYQKGTLKYCNINFVSKNSPVKCFFDVNKVYVVVGADVFELKISSKYK